MNRAHLVVKVDGKRPVSVVVMAGQSMVAEVTIEEVRRVHEQVARMQDHWDKFIGRSHGNESQGEAE